MEREDMTERKHRNEQFKNAPEVTTVGALIDFLNTLPRATQLTNETGVGVWATPGQEVRSASVYEIT